MTDQAAIPWYKSTALRQGLAAALPGVIALAKLFHLDKKLHIDLSGVDIDGVVNLVIVILAGGTGAWIWIHRIFRGKDPEDPAPPIKTPAVVTAVKRLTNG